MKPLLSLVSVLIFSTTLIGQTAPAPKTIAGGVVNGKAISLPKPEYPKDGSATGGKVRVSVLIDETGKVVSAHTLDGIENAAFRLAAESAAKKAVFTPTTLSGQPVKVSGVIEYNFVFVPEKGYERRLRYMGLGMVLSVTRNFASDIAAGNLMMQSNDKMKQIADGLPVFAEVIPDSAFLEKLSVDERRTAIERARTAVHNSVTKYEQWQMAVGKSIGEIAGPLFVQMASGKPPDLSKINESGMRDELRNIKLLTDSAPSEFPNEILVKLKAIGAIGYRDQSLVEPEVIQEIWFSLVDLAATISPQI